MPEIKSGVSTSGKVFPSIFRLRVWIICCFRWRKMPRKFIEKKSRVNCFGQRCRIYTRWVMCLPLFSSRLCIPHVTLPVCFFTSHPLLSHFWISTTPYSTLYFYNFDIIGKKIKVWEMVSLSSKASGIFNDAFFDHRYCR